MGVKTTNRYYFHKNQLGSIIGLSNGSGDIVIEYGYDDYGKVFVKTGQGEYISIENYEGNDYSNVRLYTGREYDKELGRYYYRARMYAPEIGRFTSIDPIGPKDDINMFTYVGNNPINRIDPMGLEKVLIFVGKDNAFQTKLGVLSGFAHLQYNVYINKGYKKENISIIQGESVNEFVNAIGTNNYKELALIAHASNSQIDLNRTGKYDKIDDSTLQLLPELGNDSILTIIGCQAGKGENSIAQKISNHMNITVKASNSYILLGDYFIDGGDNMWRGAYNQMIGKPSKFLIFNPN